MTAEPNLPVVLPADFVWGAATSAYQIEGSARADGRGPSIWDTFSHTPGRVRNGDTGDIAADHYQRLEEDLDLMAWLGLRAYRFSIAWPRVHPTGTGPANQAGLDFYHRLVDGLLTRGIEPFATLYHWDLPQALADRGGWLARATTAHFADYAATVERALGDRVHHWNTVNEPWCSAFLGYATGAHAPGTVSDTAPFRAAHHLLLAHGHALAALRAGRPGHQVGIAHLLTDTHPATDRDEDRAAARRKDGTANRLFLDPVLRGVYPTDVLHGRAELAGAIRDGDLDLISAPTDFLGINHYHREHVRHDPHGGLDRASAVPPGPPTTALGWAVAPDGLTNVLTRAHKEYGGPALYVTESGAAYHDRLAADGTVNDADRVSYLDQYFRAAHQATRNGVDLRGYFVWSLMDNFEWAEGYSARFGLIHIDYRTQTRTPKASAHWYRDTIARSHLR